MIELALRSKDEGGDEDTVLAVAIILSTITGARRGELAGFRWDDIDAKTQTIRIERQWVAGKGGQTLSEPKSAIGKRVMSIGPEGLAVLERYKVTMTEVLGAEPEGWLLSPDGGRSPMRAKALGDQVTNLAGRLGLKVTTHSFRKVSSTQLVASGVDVDTAARRMGHTKEVMLAHYVLGSDDRAVAAATTLEARLIDQGLPLSEFLA
jgi:integrase